MKRFKQCRGESSDSPKGEPKGSPLRFGLLLALALATTIFTLVPSIVEAAVPKLINFQGILKDGSGNPVANASYSVTFTIYNAPSGGINLWSETQSVTTSSGLFSVLLGAITPVPDSAFKDSSRWLGVQVGADPEMTPRQQLVSVAYGFRISSVDGAAGGTITSKVSIGPGHINTGTDAFVAGSSNTATANYATIGGGDNNAAFGIRATVGGGSVNTASGFAATVGGGSNNKARGIYSVVSGGGGATPFDSNSALGGLSTVGGGRHNTASGDFATVGGGWFNTASVNSATVGGGEGNRASNQHATVGGGQSDTASGPFATVPGGIENVASGSSSFAAGARAKALHSGCFVWSEGTVFSSTGINQFLINAPGGVGIGTNSPTTATGGQVLHINNAAGPSAVRIGDGAVNGKQWEIQSTIIGTGALNFSNVSDGSNPMTILANGRVGIGSTGPSEILAVNGNICAVGTIGVCSDARYKTNLREIPNALNKVKSLHGIFFNWKRDEFPALNFKAGNQVGFVAQELKQVLPEAVSQGSDGYYSVDYGRLTPLLVEAIKEQQKQIEELKEKIARLEKTKTQARVE